MPVEYLYTAGIAGEKLFREIRDRQKLAGTVCTKCRVIYFPPLFYCEKCFRTLEKWKSIPPKGNIFSYTISYTDTDGKSLPEPAIWGFITFPKVTGGLIHKIGEIKPEEIKIGLTVTPVFAEPSKRTGSISDIIYFKPV